MGHRNESCPAGLLQRRVRRALATRPQTLDRCRAVGAPRPPTAGAEGGLQVLADRTVCRADSAPSARGLAHDGGELVLGRVVQRGEEPRALKELVRRALLAGEVRLVGEAERRVFLVNPFRVSEE